MDSRAWVTSLLEGWKKDLPEKVHKATQAVAEEMGSGNNREDRASLLDFAKARYLDWLESSGTSLPRRTAHQLLSEEEGLREVVTTEAVRRLLGPGSEALYYPAVHVQLGSPIRLAIEPWVTTESLASIYLVCQKRVLGKRQRKLGTKALLRFHFAHRFRMDVEEQTSWKVLFEKWKAGNPDDPCQSWKQFARDYGRTRRALLLPIALRIGRKAKGRRHDRP